MKILALSGFLGLPQDWEFLQWPHLISVDGQAFSGNSLADWGKAFNQWTNKHYPDAHILMGYSLGGRLALHALIDQPQRWLAAIIISAHPGLADPQERAKRWQQDQKWAKRFESENWKNLMEAWNTQEVFAGDSFKFERQKTDYQRHNLVKILLQGSLGKQADLRQQIAALPIPLLWITGSQDERYCRMAQSLTFAHPHSCWKQIAQAGHRVPWSQPHVFSEIVTTFFI